MTTPIKAQIENNAPFARVQSLTPHVEAQTITPGFRRLVLLDRGTPVAFSDNIRYDALNITENGVFRINVYLDQITEVEGSATLPEVCELMKNHR